MAFLKPTKERPEVMCLSCGSSLLKQDAFGIHCFLCGAGEWEPTMMECYSYNDPQLQEMFGREPGECWEIPSRINTHGAFLSPLITSVTVSEFIKGKHKRYN